MKDSIFKYCICIRDIWYGIWWHNSLENVNIFEQNCTYTTLFFSKKHKCIKWWEWWEMCSSKEIITSVIWKVIYVCELNASLWCHKWDINLVVTQWYILRAILYSTASEYTFIETVSDNCTPTVWYPYQSYLYVLYIAENLAEKIDRTTKWFTILLSDVPSTQEHK